MAKQDDSRERTLVTKLDGKRPYGAKLTFQVLHAASIGYVENASVLLESGAIAVFQPAKKSASWEGGRTFQVALYGFSTAATAEMEGQRLAQSMLLLATSLNFGLRLIYHGQRPATVYERFRSQGGSVFGEGATGYPAPVVLEELVVAYQVNLLDPTLSLSMELYCAAMLETNERARFINVVSALEPLAKQEPLDSVVTAFVESMIETFNAILDIKSDLRDSLRNRIKELQTESVRQAIFRMLGSWFPERTDLRKQVDHAYSLRSKLLHTGTLPDPDTDLDTQTNGIASILRSIYAKASGLPFRVPADQQKK